MKRFCEICFEKKTQSLYRQPYYFPDYPDKVFFDIEYCPSCGFLFVANIEEVINLQNYYQRNLKYTPTRTEEHLSTALLDAHKKFFSFVDNFLHKSGIKKSLKILDVGCAAGHFLYTFKEHSYTNILGIDPVEENQAIAKNQYGVLVKTTSFERYIPQEKYDLILFSSVLEHMTHLQEIMENISSLIKDDGLVFIAVPDGGTFKETVVEPFYEFSSEHVNFFTKKSLENLFGIYNFVSVAEQSVYLDYSFDNALLVIFQKKKGVKRSINYDPIGKDNMTLYIEKSLTKQTVFENVFLSLKNQKEIAVWGAGSFTGRLLASTNLHKLPISFIVDKNEGIQQKKLNNIPIVPPSDVKEKIVPIIIGSYIHANAIEKELKEQLHYKGKVIRLDQDIQYNRLHASI